MNQLLKLFWSFFKIGAFTFGGGYAMIPMIQREIVEKEEWIDGEDIIDLFAISESVPGAIAINTATFIGYKIAQGWGAFFAMLGVTLPSFITITLIAALFAKFQSAPIVDAAFTGVRAAVTGLIIAAAIKIGKTAVTDRAGIAIFLAVFLLLVVLKIYAIYLIVLGGIVGMLIYLVRERKKQQ